MQKIIWIRVYFIPNVLIDIARICGHNNKKRSKLCVIQVAKKLGLTAHTLRYYDKEGLLPFVRKGSSGARVFEDEDVDWLIIIECLKGTGMQLKDIKKYMDLCQQGDATVGERLELFKRQ